MLHSVRVDNESIIPSKIVCIGRNYVEHIRELNNDMPAQMIIFNKPNSAISAQLYSTRQEPLHYEGEICFMVQQGQLSAVGFGLDLTKRDLQSSLKAKGLPWERAKAFDGAALFSPFISITGNINDLTLQLDINGKTVQQGSIDLMMNKPQAILTEIQSFMSVNDNDILMTGTPAGVGIVNSGDRFCGRILSNNQIVTEASWTAL